MVVNGAVRSPFDLSASTAEVNSTGQYRVGGGKGGAYGMTLDGTTVTTAGQLDGNGVTWTQINTPSVDALTEFSVTSGGFKAEMGHASGGTMSFVSKSGTNQLHGDAYEFLRNQDLDAKGFFGATKPVYKQNDFGVTVGGPVWLPKIYHGKDKTFFFFSYEGFRNRAGATPTPYSVPPPEFYTGDLHNYVNASGQDVPGLRSGHHHAGERLVCPDPVSEQPDSADRGSTPSRRQIIKYVQPLLSPNVAGDARHVGLRPQQLYFGRQHHIAEQQVQRQGRPGADLQAEDLVLFRAHQGAGPVRPHRRSGSARAPGRQPRL